MATSGRVGRLSSTAPYPGAAAVRSVTMRRTGPSKRRLRTETGTRAPTPAVMASTSATICECHRTSKSKAIAVGPRS
eukprot:scaffold116755_cov48-Phaeocystis_antarctica.AAC.1